MEPLHRKLKLILYKNNDFDSNDFEIKNRILVPRGKIRRIYRISRNVEPKKSKKIRNCELEIIQLSPPLPFPNTFLRDRSTKKNDAA